ncbi:MAG TPA: helix-turn-helix domain-containing protein [Dongiaceae bacterium]|nr:helix-turn-helix domain-containing protein [Dongiaceae bacterium]
MPFLHVKPAAPLSHFVELLWYYENAPQPHRRERLMPDGCVTLVVNLSEDQTRIYDPDDSRKVRTLPGCSVSGPHAQSFAIDTDEQTCVVGVSFRPAGAAPFLKLPSDELFNQHAGLDDLWGHLGSQLRERVLAAPTPRAKLAVVETMLLERSAGELCQEAAPAVDFAVGTFLAHPQLARIAEVTANTGFSSRHFIELFKRRVGMTPKLFCRVRRFQEVLKRIHTGLPVVWSDLAIDGGYFDQAHFIHDFRAFSGINPSKYLADHGSFPGHYNHLPIL